MSRVLTSRPTYHGSNRSTASGGRPAADSAPPFSCSHRCSLATVAGGRLADRVLPSSRSAACPIRSASVGDAISSGAISNNSDSASSNAASTSGDKGWSSARSTWNDPSRYTLLSASDTFHSSGTGGSAAVAAAVAASSAGSNHQANQA